MKELLKSDCNGAGQDDDTKKPTVLSRTIPPAVVRFYTSKISGLEKDISKLLEEDRARNKMEEVSREAERVQNILLHEDEIAARPARSWHQSVEQKKQIREAAVATAKKEDEIARVGMEAYTGKIRSREIRLDDEERAKQLKKVSGMSRLKRRRMAEAEAAAEDEEEGK
jgi:ATP-dependent RNA helicase DDX27